MSSKERMEMYNVKKVKKNRLSSLSLQYIEKYYCVNFVPEGIVCVCVLLLFVPPSKLHRM